jgi:hypothetical protein
VLSLQTVPTEGGFGSTGHAEGGFGSTVHAEGGFGSTVHSEGDVLGLAMNLGRVFFIESFHATIL